MREAIVVATCDGKRCSETWGASADTPPVRISMPDGSEYELDICQTHTQRFTNDWLSIARPAYKRPTSGQRVVPEATAPAAAAAAAKPKKKRRKRVGVGRRLESKPVNQREKVDCPISDCSSYGTTPSSLSTHIRKAHPHLSTQQVSQIVSELFGTRPAHREDCPDCGESQPIHYMSRHRRQKHGVTV